MIGTTVGSYRIERQLAQGGMGTVFLGVHPGIGSRVAIKVLSDRCAQDPALVERFFSEARAVNLIKHESIINVLDLAKLPDGRPYIIMELVEGQTLGHIIRRTRPPLGGLARAMDEVLAALAAAHAIGVIHRDLKPDNIFITRLGHAKVLDFGIAKLRHGLLGEHAPRTGSDDMLGTPAYMSPEQITNASGVDARSDLYAMGIVLYEAVTGRLPFAGSAFEMMRAQVASTPPPVDSPFAQVIAIALAKSPADRFASAAAMARALREAARGLPSSQQAALALVDDSLPSGGPGAAPGAAPMGASPMGASPMGARAGAAPMGASPMGASPGTSAVPPTIPPSSFIPPTIPPTGSAPSARSVVETPPAHSVVETPPAHSVVETPSARSVVETPPAHSVLETPPAHSAIDMGRAHTEVGRADADGPRDMRADGPRDMRADGPRDMRADAHGSRPDGPRDMRGDHPLDGSRDMRADHPLDGSREIPRAHGPRAGRRTRVGLVVVGAVVLTTVVGIAVVANRGTSATSKSSQPQQVDRGKRVGVGEQVGVSEQVAGEQASKQVDTSLGPRHAPTAIRVAKPEAFELQEYIEVLLDLAWAQDRDVQLVGIRLYPVHNDGLVDLTRGSNTPTLRNELLFSTSGAPCLIAIRLPADGVPIVERRDGPCKKSAVPPPKCPLGESMKRADAFSVDTGLGGPPAGVLEWRLVKGEPKWRFRMGLAPFADPEEFLDRCGKSATKAP